MSTDFVSQDPMTLKEFVALPGFEGWSLAPNPRIASAYKESFNDGRNFLWPYEIKVPDGRIFVHVARFGANYEASAILVGTGKFLIEDTPEYKTHPTNWEVQ